MHPTRVSLKLIRYTSKMKREERVSFYVLCEAASLFPTFLENVVSFLWFNSSSTFPSLKIKLLRSAQT